METKKFLQFNGKTIYFVDVNGVYWIALKTICEALGVDYSRQLRTMKSDKILGELWSHKTMVAADGKLRKMVSLPEFYLYGWIFQIQSDSSDLLKYKWECYRILFDYFHGSVTQRQGILKEKTLLDIEIEKLENKISATEDSKKLAVLRSKKKMASIKLQKLDNQIVEKQLDLWKTN